MILHAGLVAARIERRRVGVLIEGPSGSGKSDLAIRLIEAGFSLVADDRVLVWTSGGHLYGRAPGPLAGLIEARGLGVQAERSLDYARIGLLAALAAPGEIERMPEPAQRTVLGVSLPLVRLAPFEASAPAKLRRALIGLG